MNKSAACAASGDYVKFQAVIKSAASAASLRGGRASGRLDHGLFFAIFGRASGQKIFKKIAKYRTFPQASLQREALSMKIPTGGGILLVLVQQRQNVKMTKLTTSMRPKRQLPIDC